MKAALNRLFSSKDSRILFGIVTIGVLLRVIALPFAQVVDADAVTRIFIAKNWLLDPELITEGVWPPLHHYFNALIIWLTGSHITAPIVAHMLLGAFTAIPIYKFTKREISESGAWFAALFFVLSPVIFRNSFHTLSGIPYCFFIALGLNALSLSIREKNMKQALYSGLFLTIAAGFRYEAWLLIALMTGIAFYFKAWKSMIYFWLAAMIFPAFWMIGNYVAHQDFFFGLSGAYKWNIVIEGVNDSLPFDKLVLRLIYFPLTWIFLFSPIVVGWLSTKIILRIRSKEFSLQRFIWAIPFWIMFFIFIYKAYEGTLLLQHRFTSSLILLATPFTGLLLEGVQWNKYKKILVGLVITTVLPLSYFWMTVQYNHWFTKDSMSQKIVQQYRMKSIEAIEAVPRLSDQSIDKLSSGINKELNSSSGLILDFWSWESSYYIALNSNLHPKNIYQVNGASKAKELVLFVKNVIDRCPKGVIVLKCTSKFTDLYEIQGDILTFKTLNGLSVKLTPLTDNGHLYAFKYQKVANKVHSAHGLNINFCPEENSREFFRKNIKDNLMLYQECVLSGVDNGNSTEVEIERYVDWFVWNLEQQKKKK